MHFVLCFVFVSFKLLLYTVLIRTYVLKLFKPRCHTTVRQNFFSQRIVNKWNNKLPQVVIEATSVNAFQNKLDRHCKDMGVYS